MRKSLTLLPAGVLAAAIIGSACAPPPPPPPPPPPADHAARLDRLRRAELGQGRARQHRSHLLVGRRRHRRGLGRHRQRRLRRRHVQQRGLPDRPDRGARQPGRVLPGRRQRAEHVQRQLRWRPGQRPGHRRDEPVRGRELHHPQRRGLEPPGQAQRQPASATPASPRSPSRLRVPAASRLPRTACWPSPTPRPPASSTPAATSARSAPAPAWASRPGRGQRGRLHRERHADVLHR